MAKKIEEDYKGEELVCVALLKGSFIFFADLVREIKSPVQIDFVRMYQVMEMYLKQVVLLEF